MNIEKGRISGIEYVSLITTFIQGSILWISFTVNLTKHDTWLAILAGYAVSIPFSFAYAVLGKRFAGQNLVQISEVVLGSYLGKVIALMYSSFFALLLAFNLKGVGNYLVIFMPQTPMAFFIIIFVAVCAYGIFSGIEVLARAGNFFMVIGFVVILGTFFLLLEDMRLANFLPLFEIPLKDFVHGTHIIAAVPFCEIIVFLMIMPCLNDIINTPRHTLLGLFLGTVSFLVISIRNTAVLGNTEAIWSSPSFQASRLIDIGNVLTRMDIVMTIGYTVALFLKCSILYYGAVVSLAQLLCLRTYAPLIIPVGCIVVTVSMIVFDSTVDNAISAQNDAIILASLFLFVVPPLLLVVAKLRNLPKKRCTDKSLP